MDRARFLRLATDEWRAVYRFALRLARDSHRAEDLVQDVYAEALRPERIESFEPRGGGVRAWLLRITYRAFLARSERGRREAALFRELEDSVAQEAEVISAARAKDFDWEGVDEKLRNAVAGLDAGSREVLMLWAVDQLQYQEIADVLCVPIGTVMSRLHRARTRTSQALLSDPQAVEDLGLQVLPSAAPTVTEKERAS